VTGGNVARVSLLPAVVVGVLDVFGDEVGVTTAFDGAFDVVVDFVAAVLDSPASVLADVTVGVA
jgi:hypothetical protein